MKTYFYTFCVDIKRFTPVELQKSLLLLLKSIKKYIKDYEMICYTNFNLDENITKNFNIKSRKYYDNTKDKMYTNDWLNLSYNKINIYKDLYDEFKIDYIWVDLDTIITYDISYLNSITNCFVEHGGKCISLRPLIKDNSEIMVPMNRYIQGNFWKLNIKLYNDLMQTLDEIKSKKMTLRFDLQDLYNYHIYIKNEGKLDGFNILGYNYKPEIIVGISVWSERGDLKCLTNTGIINAISNLYYENEILKTKFYPEKNIHFFSFTFLTLRVVWDSDNFKKLFF